MKIIPFVAAHSPFSRILLQHYFLVFDWNVNKLHTNSYICIINLNIKSYSSIPTLTYQRVQTCFCFQNNLPYLLVLCACMLIPFPEINNKTRGNLCRDMTEYLTNIVFTYLTFFGPLFYINICKII